MGGKNSGRKPGYKNKKRAKRTAKLAIRINPEILERLRDESQISGLSQSDIIETSLENHWKGEVYVA